MIFLKLMMFRKAQNHDFALNRGYIAMFMIHLINNSSTAMKEYERLLSA
jgi:hypothetical protein